MIDDLRNEWNYLCRDLGGFWHESQKPYKYIIVLYTTFVFLPAYVLGFILAGTGYYRLLRALFH